MAKKKSAAERRAQSKRAAERVAAAEPASAMSAAEADAQAQLLAQCRPPPPTLPPSASSRAPSGPLPHVGARGPVHVLSAEQRAHPDVILIRQLAEWRRQQALRPPTPPRAHVPCDDDAPPLHESLTRRRVSFCPNPRTLVFNKDDPPCVLCGTAYAPPSAPPSGPPSAATSLTPCPTRPPVPQIVSSHLQPSSSPRPPRDLLSLVAGSTRRPWRGLQHRRQRQRGALHPHRHQRQRRDDTRLQADRQLLDRAAQLHVQEDELREAVYAALEPIYPLASTSRASGWVTPEAPMRSDPGQVAYEVALCVFNGEVEMGFHQPDAVASQNDINRIQAGTWAWSPEERSGLIASHSFLVRNRRRWDRGLDDFAIHYLIGMHNRFCNG